MRGSKFVFPVVVSTLFIFLPFKFLSSEFGDVLSRSETLSHPAVVKAGLFSFVQGLIDSLSKSKSSSSSAAPTNQPAGESVSPFQNYYPPTSVSGGVADADAKELVAGAPLVKVEKFNLCRNVTHTKLPSTFTAETLQFPQHADQIDPATFFRVGVGTTAGLEVFVPTKSEKEWRCFVQKPPPGVDLTDCAAAAAAAGACIPPPTVPCVTVATYPVGLSECAGHWCGGAKNKNKKAMWWLATTADWLCVIRGHSRACDWDFDLKKNGGAYCAYNSCGGMGCDLSNSGISPILTVRCGDDPGHGAGGGTTGSGTVSTSVTEVCK